MWNIFYSKQALKDIKKINRARKITVLGDMLELGKYSSEEHYKAGKLAAGVSDILITVGIRSRKIAEGAQDALLNKKDIYQFEDSFEAGKYIKNLLKEGDIILVKGSQSIRTERIVEEVMLEPEKARELLVRQESEWKNK